MKNSKQPDKFKTETGNRQAHFVLLDSSFEPPFEQVTSVALVPFTDDGKVVVVVEKRGPDLPGGHGPQYPMLSLSFNPCCDPSESRSSRGVAPAIPRDSDGML